MLAFIRGATTKKVITIPSLRPISIPFLLANQFSQGIVSSLSVSVSNNHCNSFHRSQPNHLFPVNNKYHSTGLLMTDKQKQHPPQPAQPYKYYSSSSIGNIDLSELDATISIAEEQRQDAFNTSAKIKVLITRTRRSLEQQTVEDSAVAATDQNDVQKELESLMEKTLPAEKKTVRVANLSFQFQEYARLKAFQYFLSSNGKLIPPSQLPPSISDEEYLAGAVIGLTQDLARYVVGRATARDAQSVMIARDLANGCLEYLMKFDFRNGMLRRKYDGVKYALKTCETVLYELSVTGIDIDDSNDAADGAEPDSKRMKLDHENGSPKKHEMMPNDELEQLRSRMEHRDELREKLIKRCRDAQKAAKQAIFALHRNDFKRATKLINECETVIQNDLNPMVDEDPSLHYGSYANVLEEYAEAKLFNTWLMDKPQGQLLHPNGFTKISLEPAEYLGGLCDLTGEVGRYAVQRGTKRDSKGVQFCLETNLSILFALETLQRFPSGSYISKKMDQLRRSVEKLERMLYELSLVQATGRQIVADSVNESEVNRNGGTNDAK